MRKSGLIAVLALGIFALMLAALLPISDLEIRGHRVWFALILAGSFLPMMVARHCLQGMPEKQALLWLWAGAVILRLVIFGAVPGNDLWRYVWEGLIQWAGHSPYLSYPADPALVGLRPEWWGLINHPEWSAIYPPAAQGLFALLFGISPTIWPFKVMALLMDLLTLGLLLRLMTGKAGRVGMAAWYGWNPLVIYVFAGGGHYDSWMLAAMMGAFVVLRPVLDREPACEKQRQRILAGGGLLGLAISVKLIPILLLPLLFLRLRFRAIWLLPGLAVPLGLALAYGWPTVPVFEKLGSFSNVARFNDWVWWIPETLLGWNPTQKNFNYNRVIPVMACLFAFYGLKDWRRASVWVLGSALILTPIFHPWYVSWVLPLAVLAGSGFWLVASCSLVAAYIIGDSGWWWTAWHPEIWQRLLVIGPPILYGILWMTAKLWKRTPWTA